MAPDSSNQANLRKCLASNILFLIFINYVTCVEYYIVPSQGYPCSVDHCLTLSQFVSTFSNCSECDNVTLIFASGSYDLESDFLIEDVDSFSMVNEPFSMTHRIVCRPGARFEFRNVSIITIRGLDFVDCYGNVFVSVGRFHLTESTFYSHPERDGTTLYITESTAHLERVAFLATTESAQDHAITTVTLKPRENCSATIYRIVTNNSDVIIEETLFDTSIVGEGAVISDLDNRSSTLPRCHRLDAATLSRAVHGGHGCARVIAHASALNFTWPSYSSVNFGLRL
jgi:hypothetical protein